MDLLSPHLSLAEFLATAHRALVPAQEAGWAGTPTLILNARRLAAELFEPARDLLGVPLHVTSGYRCARLNRTVGGRPTSRHVFALAIDFVPIGMDLGAAFATLADATRMGRLPEVDEVIREMNWIHLQAAAEGTPRRLCLVTHDGWHFSTWT